MDRKQEIIEQLRQLQVLMHRMAFHGFQQHSTYRGRGKVLSLLSDQPVMTRKELGERLNISRQGLTELLGKLEKSGHITREVDPADRRAVLIRLTEQGRAAAKESDEGRFPLTGLLDCLSEEQLDAFQGCLTDILTAREDSPCSRCAGPENCSHDYLKYGHSRPNKEYCKYIHRWSGVAGDDEKGDQA